VLKNNQNMRNKKHQTKLFAGIISIFILGLLIVSGPASAFILSLSVNGDSSVESGKTITFTATVDIKNNENLPIEEIVLILDGPEHRECVFDITGKLKNTFSVFRAI
jgi:hypothetical protein